MLWVRAPVNSRPSAVWCPGPHPLPPRCSRVKCISFKKSPPNYKKIATKYNIFRKLIPTPHTHTYILIKNRINSGEKLGKIKQLLRENVFLEDYVDWNYSFFITKFVISNQDGKQFS